MVDRDAGFTLVEAIAALAVAALAAAGLMSALGSARARTIEAEMRVTAVSLARSLLDEAVAAPNLNQLPRRGKTGAPSLSWTIGVGQKDQAYPGIIEVDVRVEWSAAGKTGNFQLSAYRPAPEA
jgi:prepilin-type N-terminal cleavage/methylation domain-containing protein